MAPEDPGSIPGTSTFLPHLIMAKILLLMTGGGLGTLARYMLSSVTSQTLGARFPYGTLAVNLIGCFFAGFLVILIENKFFLSPTREFC